MARTILPITIVVGAYPTLQPAVNTLDVTETAADTGNLNMFKCTGKEILLVHNSDAVNPYTFTVTSVVDKWNRTGDITAYSLAATEIASWGPVELAGWRQADGYIYLQGSNAAILFSVLRIA